jgi:predicted dehydrogenase
MKKINRRALLKTVVPATIAAYTIPTLIPHSAFGANDRLRIAVLGVNGRGKSHIAGFMEQDNVEVATLCDPDMNISGQRAKEFEAKYGKKVSTEQDLRKVYEDKSIDAVSIATPNHWHALAAIWACQAGKDVYVEKPACHTVWEGQQLVAAAKKYKRIVQHGVQLRSSKSIQEAIQHLRDGLIGNVYMARGTVYKWRPDIGNKGNSAVPAGLDWNMWQGPAKPKEFSENYVHYNWHWFWDYGNGDIGNQGIHETDLAMWGLDVGLPEEITSAGGKYLWNDCKETPELLTSTYNYPKEKKIIEFEVRPWMTNQEDGVNVGNIFYGDKGYMVINGYADYKTFLGREKEPGPSGKEGGDHFKNFVEAVRAQDYSHLNGPIETGYKSSALAHLGNIAYRLGRRLDFDPVTEKFKSDAEANAMLKGHYRAPFMVPKIV